MANLGRITMDPVGVVVTPTPVDALGSFITARCRDDPWTLTLSGLVERELQLTMADLRTLPRHEVTAFLECAGNRGDPDKPTRIVSNARWGGVSLAIPMAKALDEDVIVAYGSRRGLLLRDRGLGMGRRARRARRHQHGRRQILGAG